MSELTTEDTEATEKRAKKQRKLYQISKDLDRLLLIYETTILCANHSETFVNDLQSLISDVIRNSDWTIERWPVDPDSPEFKWLEKLEKGGAA
jgi:hypothetical protein